MAFFSDLNYTPRQALRPADDEDKNKYLTPLERFYWARTWRREADIAFFSGDYKHWQEIYEKILKRTGVNAMLDDYRCAASANFRTGNFDRAMELWEEVLTKAGVRATLNDYIHAAVANFRAHNFGRAAELRLESRKSRKHYPTVMNLTNQINLFSSLHYDPHRYAKEIADALKSDLLTGTEKETYLSIFQNFSENREATVQAIDEFLSHPDNDDPNSSNLSEIIYQVGYMLHTIDGDTAKADELKTKLGW